jgi:hypothetical protein
MGELASAVAVVIAVRPNTVGEELIDPLLAEFCNQQALVAPSIAVDVAAVEEPCPDLAPQLKLYVQLVTRRGVSLWSGL